MNRARTSRHLQLVAAFVVIAIPVAAACGGKIDGQNGSAGPMPSSTPTSTSSATATATTDPEPPLANCTSAGQSTLDGGSCPVSFSGTIFGNYMSPNGAWACSNASCHGPSGSGGSSLNTPTIDGTSAYAAYVALTSLQFNGKPYIDACSTDPSASSIVCNLNGSCSPTMPTSGGGVTTYGVTAPELRDLETWIQCGAPFN